MSACSHGILALAIELYKKGASVPAVITFLLASPWANITITIMLIGFFGLKAFFIIFSAIVIAIITGFIFLVLQKKNLIEKNVNTASHEDGFSIIDDIKRRYKNYRFSAKTAKTDIKSEGGTVFVHGEFWNAVSSRTIKKGQQVKVVAVDNMILTVESVGP